MNTHNLFLQSGRLYPYVPYLTRRSVQYLRKEWIKQVTYLGDNWILCKKVQKCTT